MYIYFIISTLINKTLMAPSVRLTVEMEQREGDFRFKHMELRSHAESLALSGSVEVELGKVNRKLVEVCRVQQLLYNWNLPIDLSVNLFNYLGAILSYIVIAVPIFGGVYDDLDSGELAQVISETGFVCMYLVYQLTQLVNITSTVAGLAGSTHRVTELIERLQVIKIKEEEENEDLAEVSSVTSEDGLLEKEKGILNVSDKIVTVENEVFFELDKVSFRPPGWDRDLISDLSLCVRQSSNLLIIGPSGCGKSSLVRVLRGIWPHSGTIERRLPASEFMFLAQSPFLSSGSLLDQVTYPGLYNEASEEDRERLNSALETCHLTSLSLRYGDANRDNW